DALDWVRELIGFLPQNNRDEAPRVEAEIMEGSIQDNINEADLELDTLIPDSPNQPYDMKDVITRIIDDGDFLEIQENYAENIIIGFGRVEGRSVGIVANQPMQFAGCLDIKASEKAARFVRTCDAFNIPILEFVDVPGFLPGTNQEYEGIIRRGAKLLYAYCEATVGKITVITRKSYGGAYCVMGGKEMGADIVLAWPTAQIAVMGASGAVG
ncbi:methylmalonyl-CoA carboxyltransferase, partial [Macrococcoides caseolyticum]